MAKSKPSVPQASDNGVDTDTDVLELPQKEVKSEPEPKGTIEDWFGPKADETETETPISKKTDASPKPQEPNPDDDDDAARTATEATSASVLDAMTSGADNDFSLDSEEKPELDAEGNEVVKPKEKINDVDVISHIAKELEISGAQTPEQLVSSIKEKLSTAKAGANAPVAGLDKVLALNNRDLYKTYLLQANKFSDERAEKYISERVDTYGEEWIDQKAEDIRIDLEATREKIVQDHASREIAKENEIAQFAATARESVKEIKTLFGKIPLKEHVPALKEFQAMISTDEGLNAMRNDPKMLSEAMFMLKFGGSILEKFLESKLSENGIETWKKFYKSEIADKLLNKSKVREQTEYPQRGVKPATYVAGGWDN